MTPGEKKPQVSPGASAPSVTGRRGGSDASGGGVRTPRAYCVGCGHVLEDSERAGGICLPCQPDRCSACGRLYHFDTEAKRGICDWCLAARAKTIRERLWCDGSVCGEKPCACADRAINAIARSDADGE